MWESPLILCVSLWGAGKKKTVQYESSEFSLPIAVLKDFDSSWEVWMYCKVNI